MTRKHITKLLVVVLSLISMHGFGQAGIEQKLFEPELVMKFKEEIQLTADQEKTIRSLHQEAQAKYISLKWDMSDKLKALDQALNQQEILIEEAVNTLKEQLELEQEIKILQFTLYAKIRNVLSSGQKDYLYNLKYENASGK